MLAKPITQSIQAMPKDQLRFITCGSVDDGKSTLIGRLLHDSKMIYQDQMTALERDSAKHGTTGREIDFALLVDGLEAEREQGITIDVAYRFFATERRSFMVADTPGHEQYTATWQLAPQMLSSPSSSSMPVRACWSKPSGTRSSVRSLVSATSSWQ
ncbi:sulfate adenylyltransferase subunit 1 (EFTu-like GTPase family) [Bradyrhizobium sp. USDA 4510]